MLKCVNLKSSVLKCVNLKSSVSLVVYNLARTGLIKFHTSLMPAPGRGGGGGGEFVVLFAGMGVSNILLFDHHQNCQNLQIYFLEIKKFKTPPTEFLYFLTNYPTFFKQLLEY